MSKTDTNEQILKELKAIRAILEGLASHAPKKEPSKEPGILGTIKGFDHANGGAMLERKDLR